MGRTGIDRQCPPVYGVNSDQPSEWEGSVRHPAFEIVEAYMNGVGVLGHQPLPCTASAHSFEDTRQTFNCQHCNVTLKGKIQYEAHINSRRHKKTVASQKKKAGRTKPSLAPASVIGISKVSVIEQWDDNYLRQYLDCRNYFGPL